MNYKTGFITLCGLAGALGATYLTTIYLPARIIRGATSAAAVAMKQTPLCVFTGTIADTAVIAGAEAYGAAKATGWIGWSAQAVLGSASMGYAVGTKASELMIDSSAKVAEKITAAAEVVVNCAEKVYETASSWGSIIRNEKSQAAATTAI
jgi:hypothetical protein